VNPELQAPVWVFLCVLMPLVGVSHASRMILLSLLPARLRGRLDCWRDACRMAACRSGFSREWLRNRG